MRLDASRQSSPIKTMSMSDMSEHAAAAGGFDEEEVFEMREHIKHLEAELVAVKNMQHDLSKKLTTRLDRKLSRSFSQSQKSKRLQQQEN